MNTRNLLVFCLGFGTAGMASAEVQVVPVTQTVVAGIYVADATIQAVKQSVVSAQVAGRVLQLLVRSGDAVKAGQVIVRLDDRELGAAEASSQAATYEAQANLARAELDFKRTQELARRNFVSTAALDQAENQVKALRARVDSLRASAGAASATRSHAVVTAPYDGFVAATQVDVGDMAMPGKPLITLFQPGKLRAVAYVPEARMEGLRAGLSTTPPEIELGRQIVVGTQTTILPTADPGTRTTEIRVDLPASVQAMPGQFARTRFAMAKAGTVQRLSIPEAAVLKRGELTAVYVKTADGRFQQRQIRLGEALPDGRIEVLAGLRAGENVALDPVKAGIESSAASAGK
jgi:RND family efflux transporter MFP subunit